jgi:CRISPR-associated protein Cas1
MIKRTLYFGNPAYLSFKNKQLVISRDKEKHDTIPIEDIGIIIFDHYGITISHYLLVKLLENNVAVITCNDIHHPNGMFLNLDGNTVQSEKFKAQIEASEPLKKQLWAQTVSAKILNQAEILRRKNIPAENMIRWSKIVKSGDTTNLEARAAAYYWKVIFPDNIEFYRSRMGPPPNNLLNYGYAILRAIISRSLVASGLLPTLGIHHHNKYNAYCLADDIMEPYRPFVDELVSNITNNGEDYTELSPSVKKQLLEIATVDVLLDGQKSPLMIASQRTTASLAKCFEGEARKILYPKFVY